MSPLFVMLTRRILLFQHEKENQEMADGYIYMVICSMNTCNMAHSAPRIRQTSVPLYLQSWYTYTFCYDYGLQISSGMDTSKRNGLLLSKIHSKTSTVSLKLCILI